MLTFFVLPIAGLVPIPGFFEKDNYAYGITVEKGKRFSDVSFSRVQMFLLCFRMKCIALS